MNFKNLSILFLINIIPIVSITYIILGFKLLKNNLGKKINNFSFLLFACAVYSLGYFFEINSLNENIAFVVRDFEYLGVSLLPAFGMLFISQIAHTKLAGNKFRYLLFGVSITLWLLFITNSVHSLFYRSIEFVTQEYGLATITEKGPAYFALLAYFALFLIYSSITLKKAISKPKLQNIKSFKFLFVSFLLPWISIIYIMLGFDIYVDIAPITIMIMCFLFLINETNNNMFEVQKINWLNIFLNVDEPAFLVNSQNEIVCTNNKADDLLQVLIISTKDLVSDLENCESENKPLSIIINNDAIYYKVKKKYFDKNFTCFILSDNSEKEKADEIIRRNEEKYRLLITQMQQGLAVHEIICNKKNEPVDYRFLSVNDSFERLTGLKGEEIIGKTVLEILPNTEKQWIERYGNVALTGEPDHFESYSSELDRHYSVNAYSPKKNQFAVIVSDITERKKKEEEIEYLSFHDQLTGIFNRRYYEQKISELDKEENLPLTLMMIDVNGLKLTNDAFGHIMGDVLLLKVSKILSNVCRKEDLVARIGGDEFVILLPKSDKTIALDIIDRINATIALEKNDKVILSVSMGFAVKERINQNLDDIFKEAEDEMYRHKLSESTSMRSNTIGLIMNSLYEKNNREMMHSIRVSELCAEIATKMNFSKNDIQKIKIAGLMHDIGKIGIDENILNKTRKLDNREMHMIKRHTEIGYRILSSVNEFSKIADFVLEHHE